MLRLLPILLNQDKRNPLKKIGWLKENDSIVWYSMQPRRIQNFELMPRNDPGGAIIDLTSPSGARLLPGKK